MTIEKLATIFVLLVVISSFVISIKKIKKEKMLFKCSCCSLSCTNCKLNKNDRK